MSPDFATDTLNGIVHGLIGLSNRGCNLSAAAAIQIQIQHADLQFGKLTAYLIQQCRSLFSVNKQILRIELTVLWLRIKQKCIQGYGFIERTVLACSGRPYHGAQAAADADLGKGLKTGFPIRPELTHGFYKPDHSLLQQILAVAPCQKIGVRTATNQPAVSVGQNVACSSITRLQLQSKRLVCELLQIFILLLHIFVHQLLYLFYELFVKLSAKICY